MVPYGLLMLWLLAYYGSILSPLVPVERHQMFCPVSRYKVYCPLNACVPNLRLLQVSEVDAQVLFF